MSYLRIIPSLLISNGKLVKGINFKNFKNAGSPVTTVAALDSQKADEIFIVDIDCYNKKKLEPNFELLKKIAEINSTPITFGGGIKNIIMAKKAFSSGADKIFLNSIIFNDEKIIKKIALQYGSQSIVAGMNIINKNGKYSLMEDNSNTINPIEYAKRLEKLGAGELKVIFVNLEGTKKGVDISYSQKINHNVKIPCIFEGGIGNLDQLDIFFRSGLTSIGLGSLITFSDYNIVKIKHHLINKNFNVRI
tara:strand:- start:61 stop:807 length:747 start_codon:yes stop_codon:yes gene_type:complete